MVFLATRPAAEGAIRSRAFTALSLSRISSVLCLLSAALLFAACPGPAGDDDDSSSEPTPTPSEQESPTVDPYTNDQDHDGVVDDEDNCPDDPNTEQMDTDEDGTGDVCDTEECDGMDNDGDDQIDEDFPDDDEDGLANCMDACPFDLENDVDADEICGDVDNCPEDANTNQADIDSNGVGDVCDEETCDGLDNDGDGQTDEDFDDTDGDGQADCVDACPLDADNDEDGDEVCGDVDNCPVVSNLEQTDFDMDGYGDVCDNCMEVVNEDQADMDSDGIGDLCDDCPDDDADGDGFCLNEDNCPNTANENQMDRDLDGVGDLCDPCPEDFPDDPDSDGQCGEGETIENPEGAFIIYGTFPDEGYQQAPVGNITGRIYFNDGFPVDSISSIHVDLVSQYGTLYQPQSISISGTEARFVLPLSADTDYCMMVNVDYIDTLDARWPLEHTACFTTKKPCGVGVDVGGETDVVRLGANPAVLATLNGLIQYYGNSYPVILLFEDIYYDATFPLTADAALGAYDLTDNELKFEGYTSSFEDCIIDAMGAFSCFGPKAIFPVFVNSFGVDLIVTDAEMYATAYSSGNFTTMEGFVLKGVMTEDDLARVGTETGFSEVVGLINLDVDMDGDGEKDAASFEVHTVPSEVELNDSYCPAPTEE